MDFERPIDGGDRADEGNARRDDSMRVRDLVERTASHDVPAPTVDDDGRDAADGQADDGLRVGDIIRLARRAAVDTPRGDVDEP